MLRSSLTTAGVLLLGASAFAQADASARVKPITGPIRDGGIYHVTTGAWTRHASQASIGADIIYNNTCVSGYYSAFSGDTFVDEGRIPSPTSPSSLASKPGCATSYTIDGFQLGYCTDQLSGTFTYTVNFYQSYAACATVIGVTPTAGFAINGLPGAIAGAGACWLVNLDLDSPPQTASLAFTMLADGDGTYSGTSPSNLFGWEMKTNLTVTTGNATGPLIAGNFGYCLGYDGTRWDSPINYLEDGTGMGTLDQFRIEGGTTNPGCYFFGGVPPASFHLELYADACSSGPVITGTKFCIGDGVAPHTACPCGNNSTTASASGCLNSFGVGANFTATGTPSVAADTVVLSCSNLPAASVLFFQGTSQQNLGNGSLFGDGLRCAGGTIIRLHTHVGQGTPGAAVSSYPSTGPDHSGTPDPRVSVRGAVPAAGGTRTYQAWYRNGAAFCTASTFNLSNGFEIVWTP